MNHSKLKILSGEVLEEETVLTVTDLCRACHVTSEQIVELVEYGVIEPQGNEPSSWRFKGGNLRKVHRVQHLKRDLGVNVAGAALVLDLLSELEQLRLQLRRLESHRKITPS